MLLPAILLLLQTLESSQAVIGQMGQEVQRL
jgi:hypothetical protein